MTYLIYIIFIFLVILGILMINMRKASGANILRFYMRKNNLTFILRDKLKETWAVFYKNKIKKEYEKQMYYEACFVRNIAIGESSSKITSDVLITMLIDHENSLADILSRTLSIIRLNKDKEAMEYFVRHVDSPMSGDFIRILISWDRIKPKDLSSALLSFQNSMRERIITQEKRKDEIISDLLYMPVILNVILVLMNFIYVSYYIQQREMFKALLF